jgi:hypothetical protein
MTKAAIIISAILVFAGVAAASSLPGLGGGSNSPTIDTPTLGTTTNAATTNATATNATTTNEAEDISGPCDEAEHANDPRCTGVAPQARGDDEDDGDRRGRNRGPGGGDDHDDNSGPGGDDEEDNSGPGGGNDD